MAPFLFYAVHGRMPYDEAAEKQVWDVKGASGLIPCYECRNVVLKQEGRCLVNFDSTGYLQPLSCTDVTKFDRMTDELVWSTYDCLAARRGGDAASAKTMSGINVNPLWASRMRGFASSHQAELESSRPHARSVVQRRHAVGGLHVDPQSIAKDAFHNYPIEGVFRNP